LEKGADIIIADAARKDAPPGSINWKYITDSVKNGVLQELDDYPASSKARAAPAVAGASSSKPVQTQPTRSGRTPFTHEDDRVLMEFCARKERQGGSLKGNKIFVELEALVNSSGQPATNNY
jgi:hypothetical protein